MDHIFLRKLIIGICLLSVFTCYARLNSRNNAGVTERKYLVNSLVKVADPVLTALAENRLKKDMPVEAAKNDRYKYTYLEAFGRLLAGMAPWLELGADASAEGKLREKYLRLAQLGLDHATDPSSPDYMNFKEGGQPLVDAAFLAQALLRAPNQLWAPLPARVKQNIIAALKETRIISPPNTNWLLFSAEVEAALLRFEGVCDMTKIDYALKMHEQWYKGDGTYGDGPNYHWDYYNSYVIQPMLLDVMQVMSASTDDKVLKNSYATILKRAQRYASVQESLISPEGTYPALGRSLAYRFGAFQLLSQVALMTKLPESITPRQVRAALYTVIKKQIEIPGTFDKKGWLTIGFYGHQPKIGEVYISTGSLYLCSQAFLVLGLPADNEFWTGADESWTSLKLLNGFDISVDHSIY